MKKWTTLIFAIPLFVALMYKLYIMALVISVTTAISVLYHLNEEKKLKALDKGGAIGLIIANLWLCYLFEFAFPYFYIVLLFVGFALYFYGKTNKKNYEIYHSRWHIASAIITLFCIIGYAQSRTS